MRFPCFLVFGNFGASKRTQKIGKNRKNRKKIGPKIEKNRGLGKVGECYPATKSPTVKKRVSRRFPLESQTTEGSSRWLLLCMIPIQNDSHIFPIFSPIFLGGSFLFFSYFVLFWSDSRCAPVQLHKDMSIVYICFLSHEIVYLGIGEKDCHNFACKLSEPVLPCPTIGH